MSEERNVEPAGERFRAVLFRVLAVQVVTLALLWALQARYHAG